MKAGNVLFESKSSDLISKTIAVADGLFHLQGPTEFSHVAIALGGNLVFEAYDSVYLSNVLANNVDCRNNPRSFKQGFKYKGPVEESLISASLFESVTHFLFQDYSYLKMFNVIGGRTARDLKDDDFGGMFCSSLVQTILHNARLISDQNSMPHLTPEGLRRQLADSNEWERFDLPNDYFDDPVGVGPRTRSHIEHQATYLLEAFLPIVRPLVELLNSQFALITFGDQVDWPAKPRNVVDVDAVVKRFTLNLEALKNMLALIRLFSTVEKGPNWMAKKERYSSRYVWVVEQLARRIIADCDFLEAALEFGLIVAPATDDVWRSFLSKLMNVFGEEQLIQTLGCTPGASLPDVTRKLGGLIMSKTS